MITKTKAFTTSDGKIFGSIEAAQLHELSVYLAECGLTGLVAADGKLEAENLAQHLLSKKAHLIDLLTMKSNSHPKARKVNGGSRTRSSTVKPLTATKPEAA